MIVLSSDSRVGLARKLSIDSQADLSTYVDSSVYNVGEGVDELKQSQSSGSPFIDTGVDVVDTIEESQPSDSLTCR